MKRLPPLLPEWRLLIITEGHADYQPDYHGYCFPAEKLIHIYCPADRVYKFYGKVGRVFSFDEGFSFVYCHEWFHSLHCSAPGGWPKDSELAADDFAIAYCRARGIIY